MKTDKSVFQTLALVTQFGINMLVPIFMCSFAGIYLDKKFNTGFCMILLFFIGAISGGYNVYRMSKRYMKNDDALSPYAHGRKRHDERMSDTGHQDEEN